MNPVKLMHLLAQGGQLSAGIGAGYALFAQGLTPMTQGVILALSAAVATAAGIKVCLSDELSNENNPPKPAQ
jgi:hypothetical protein